MQRVNFIGLSNHYMEIWAINLEKVELPSKKSIRSDGVESKITCLARRLVLDLSHCPWPLSLNP